MDSAQTDQELLEKEFNTSGKLSIDEMIGADKELPIFLSEWLGNGLNATKLNEQTEEKVPDYKQSLIPRKLGIKTRLEFHRILGKLLGF